MAMVTNPSTDPIIEATARIIEEVTILAVTASPITGQAIPTAQALAPGPICISPDSSVDRVASIPNRSVLLAMPVRKPVQYSSKAQAN